MRCDARAVHTVRLSLDNTGISRGYAFVTIVGKENAARAVASLTNRIVDGRQIKVEYSATSTRRKCLQCANARLGCDKCIFVAVYAFVSVYAGPGAPPASAVKKRNIHVTGLPEDFSDLELKNLFGTYGEVESMRMLKPDRMGKNGGVALVRYVA